MNTHLHKCVALFVVDLHTDDRVGGLNVGALVFRIAGLAHFRVEELSHVLLCGCWRDATDVESTSLARVGDAWWEVVFERAKGGWTVHAGVAAAAAA